MISLDRATGLGRELAEVADQEILRRRQRTLETLAHFDRAPVARAMTCRVRAVWLLLGR